MSEIFALQLTAVATAALAILALITAWYARRAYLAQVSELRGVLDDRKQEAVERRRAQAAQVYVWEAHITHHEIGMPSQPTIKAFVRNTSEQPIYDVRFNWGSASSFTHETRRVAPLPPKEEDSDAALVPGGPGWSTFGAAVTFRDRAGVWWRTRPGGRFDELPPQHTVIPPSMDDPPAIDTAP